MDRKFSKEDSMVARIISRVLVVAIVVGLVATPIGAATQAPKTTSLFVPIDGRVNVWSADGTQIVDTVWLSGEVHFVTQVRMTDAGLSANIYADLVRVAGTSETTQMKYLGVGAGVVD